jgi:NhaP-type Na+/H+ or K+/H+ antiporter
VTTSQVLLGSGVILVLAVGSQVLAIRLRLPSVIVTLPIGFAAGAIIPNLNPDRLYGPAFQAFVALAIGVLLYNAGLNLDVHLLTGPTKQIVSRLIGIGAPVTLAFAATAAGLLLGLSPGPAVITGAILVPTGRTVVRPLLSFVRPAERLRLTLSWESALLSPLSAILAAFVFHGVDASNAESAAEQAAQFVTGLGTGLLGGVIGSAVLYVLLRKLALAQPLGTGVQLATVVGITAGCDVLRTGTGIIAAVIMGLAVGNQRGFNVPVRRPFFDTLVGLVRGVLLLTIAITVTPGDVARFALPALAITAVLVLVARPVSALLATRGTDLTRRERIFVGWMAPRGDVAVVTAAAFARPLVLIGVPEAGKILPVIVLVVVMTIGCYGLAAVPTARFLGVLRSPRSRPLLVGGEDWVIDLGRTLQTAGLDVLMWAGLEGQRERIRQATLPLAAGEMLASVAADRAELTGVTEVLLLTTEDDFNALAASVLRYAVSDQVFRLAPPAGDRGVVAPFTGGRVLFSQALNRSTIRTRYQAGARITACRAGGPLPPGGEILFLVRSDGQLDPATRQVTPAARDGDTLVVLGDPVALAAAGGPGLRRRPGRRQ